MPAPANPALLICLPHGLNVSGVTMWALRLSRALAEHGWPVALALHAEPPGQQRLDLPIHPCVRVIDCTPLPAIGSIGAGRGAGGDLGPLVGVYRAAVDQLSKAGGPPVVLSPNLLGDCYAIAAALSQETPDRIRVVGLQHSDNTYDSHVLDHYQPILHALVGVSASISESLRGRIPDRAGDVRHIPYGVPIPDRQPTREPLRGRPVRLLYTGRMEQRQKRILALPALSRELDRRGIDHDLVLLGDGPAEREVDEALTDLPHAQRRTPGGPDRVAAMLDRADALVLGSRFEGLSVAMLEAMARGCVPIATRVRSGLSEAIEDGSSGLIAPVEPEADENAAALGLADAVERFLATDAGRLSHSAWARARERFSIGAHADAVMNLLDRVVEQDPRSWPADRPCQFAAGGSVPPDGAQRLAALLDRLGPRRVIVHGVGRHTLELEPVFRAAPVRIVAFTDDDRARHGGSLWGRPIIAPDEAGRCEATDVVVSSWIHAQAIWDRRGVYERQDLTVWRVYE